MSLYHKYRPRTLGDMIGQDDVVSVLNAKLNNGGLPHAVLLTGPSGTGKTTTARILKRQLHCGDADFNEVNMASSRGIDTIREIQQRMGLSPMSGRCRIWLLDEAHAATGQSQQALLKTLEDTPKQCYFFLCTTEPGKIIRTIHTRCMELKFTLLSPSSLEKLIRGIVGKEGMTLTDAVVARLVEVAEGSARKALVLLDTIQLLADETAQLDAISKSDSKRQAVDVARLLLDTRTKWPEVASILKELEDEPETIRRCILGYATSVALSSGRSATRALDIIRQFQFNVYDSGKAGLVLMCSELLKG